MNKSEEVKSWHDLSLWPALFWDTDASKIMLDTHAKTIVERVILRGTWPEFKAVLGYYGKDRIREILVNLRYLALPAKSTPPSPPYPPIAPFFSGSPGNALRPVGSQTK